MLKLRFFKLSWTNKDFYKVWSHSIDPISLLYSIFLLWCHNAAGRLPALSVGWRGVSNAMRAQPVSDAPPQWALAALPRRNRYPLSCSYLFSATHLHVSSDYKDLGHLGSSVTPRPGLNRGWQEVQPAEFIVKCISLFNGWNTISCVSIEMLFYFRFSNWNQSRWRLIASFQNILDAKQTVPNCEVSSVFFFWILFASLRAWDWWWRM